MKYRLSVILLSSLLLFSLSFNALYYDTIVRINQEKEFDSNYYYPKLIERLHQRINEIES
jgi:hypothetical protein